MYRKDGLIHSFKETKGSNNLQDTMEPLYSWKASKQNLESMIQHHYASKSAALPDESIKQGTHIIARAFIQFTKERFH